MKRLPAFILTLLFGFYLTSLPILLPIKAQQQSPTASFSPAPINLTAGGISEADFRSKLNDLRVEYRNRLGTYRTDEKTFQVSKNQYYQIQTLASLEEAVRSTRQVMISRLDVLQTYFDMAKLTLENTKGLETDVKAKTLQDLDTLVTDLKVHRAAVTAASDRTGLLAVATEFSALNPRVKELSTSISLLVGYGRLQTVDDKTVTIKQELQQLVEQTETEPLKLAEKKRGLDEVQRNLNEVGQLLVKVRTQLNPKERAFQQLNVSTVTNDFATIYSRLSRSIAYLEELVKN